MRSWTSKIDSSFPTYVAPQAFLSLQLSQGERGWEGEGGCTAIFTVAITSVALIVALHSQSEETVMMRTATLTPSYQKQLGIILSYDGY